jgi:hypothetical protein
MAEYTAKDLFPTWYASIVKRDASPEEITSRRKAIEKINSEEEPSFWFNTLKIALRQPVEAQFISDFSNYFKQYDESFPLADNENLISNLACCSVAQRIETNDYLSDVLSIGIQSFLFCHPEATFQISDFVPFARNKWIEECTRLRSIESATLSVSTMTFTKGDVKNTVNTQEAFDEIKAHFVKIQKDIAAVNGQVNKLINHNENVAVLAEETDMLWWVFGGRSRDTNEIFTSVEFPISIVRLAKETAELTKILPGFANIASILAKSIDSNLKQESVKKDATLTDYVNATTDQLEKDLLAYCVPELDFATPFLTSLKIRSELGTEREAWTKVMSGKYKVNLAEATLPFELAKQLYLELMLSKAHKEL